jgi:selenocysteine lyase/cysteine desulfurase
MLEILGVTVNKITDCQYLEEHVPKSAFTLAGKSPYHMSDVLDKAPIYVWDGNYYALEITKRLGLEASGGVVRVGPVPQNRWSTIGWRRSGGLGRCWGVSAEETNDFIIRR